jgi:hypothetical protein
MSYPDYPNNRLIVDGVDLTVRFQMILLDGYTLSPPEPKTYTVDVPGGDGVIDLTQSLTGDVAYKNRQQTFTFMVVNPDSFERVKTDVSNFLHGKRFDYQITMDPGYTYHGRFTVTEYDHTLYSYPGLVGIFSIKIDADPYKLKGHMTYKLNATGGKMFRLESGRKPVHPVIECTQPCKVRWKNVIVQVPAGTYRLNDVLFTQGYNEIYINSWTFCNITWGELGEGAAHQMTWDEAAAYRWDDLQRLEGDSMDVPQRWSDLAEYRWSDLADKTWLDVDFRNESVPDTTVYLSYDWKDL